MLFPQQRQQQQRPQQQQAPTTTYTNYTQQQQQQQEQVWKFDNMAKKRPLSTPEQVLKLSDQDAYGCLLFVVVCEHSRCFSSKMTDYEDPYCC
jgi:hypothetical protein